MANHEEFKKHVLSIVENILSRFSGNMWYMGIKPIVNLAKPELERTLAQNPEEAYIWLSEAKKHIDQAIEIYEYEKAEAFNLQNENNKV